jgi:hypothetical protein
VNHSLAYVPPRAVKITEGMELIAPTLPRLGQDPFGTLAGRGIRCVNYKVVQAIRSFSIKARGGRLPSVGVVRLTRLNSLRRCSSSATRSRTIMGSSNLDRIC